MRVKISKKVTPHFLYVKIDAFQAYQKVSNEKAYFEGKSDKEAEFEHVPSTVPDEEAYFEGKSDKEAEFKHVPSTEMPEPNQKWCTSV